MKQLRALLLASALTLAGGRLAHADPISDAIALSALIFNAAGGAVAVGTATAIGGFIVTSAVTFGVSATVAAIRGKPGSSAGAGSSIADQTAALRSTSRGGVVDYFDVIGEVLKSGHLFFESAKGPYLYRGYILAPHEIAGVDEVRFGTDPIALDANGFPIGTPFRTASKFYLQVSIRTGTADQQMDRILAADFPALSRTFRQRGIATAVVKMFRGETSDEANNVWGQNDPNFLFLIRGRKYFDPRDGSQSSTDPSTWKFTRNAILCTGGWLNSATGGNTPWTEIDLDVMREQADVCDQIVLRADGSFEQRYTISGVASASDDPNGTFQNMKLAMLGEMTYADGKYVILAGAPREAERTLTESSSRGGLDVSTEETWANHINTVRTNFAARDRDWQVATGPVYQDAALLAVDGEEKSVTLDLRYVDSDGQAQRICKYTIQRSQLGHYVKRGEDIEAMRHVATDIVWLEYTGGLANLSRTYEIVRHSESASRIDEYDLELAEYDGPFLFGWDPLTDERDWSQPELTVA